MRMRISPPATGSNFIRKCGRLRKRLINQQNSRRTGFRTACRTGRFPNTLIFRHNLQKWRGKRMSDNLLKQRARQDLTHYSGTAKTLHWVMAVLVLLMLAAGSQMLSASDAEKAEATIGHSAAGLLVLGLLIIRFGYRLRHTPPALPGDLPVWQSRMAVWNHRAFYLLIFVQAVAGIGAAATAPYEVLTAGIMPLSALAADDPVWFARFVALHKLNALLIAILAGIHIAAALYHHFVRKDGILRRMWPGKAKGAGDGGNAA
ncbi:MAG TPA: hypothetical protein DCF61_07645 [Alphaproteobacteria bacterium]|nr:hypothetical protein [Alphaproteobacteria bacterium]HBA42953.1 hypothetical protein [Alphaproteobacteria bacterium]